MNTLSTIKNKNSPDTTKVGLEQRQHTMYLLMIITSILVITVNYIFYFFIKFDNTKTYIISLLLTLFLPFLFNIYSILYHINFQEKRTEKENLEELEKEITSEKSNIPIILFGLGIFITKLDKKHILTIFPFLMVSLFFGTIIPEFMNTLIFDHYDLNRLTIVEEIDFTIITLSYGFLIMSIYLITFAYLSNTFIK
jgi:hypothetical protein